jgi:hypothetical protein
LVLFVTIDKKIDHQERQQFETDQRCPDSFAIFPIQRQADTRDQDTGEAEAFIKSEE